MSLAAGQKIGHYEIVSSLGAGGMGEVYRARDTNLKRDVAIKVLPEDLAGDQDRLARFRREAEVLASLNHPHIAHVYDVEGAALVMELVEGDDLSQRIARGPIPIDEALPIARQIAEALEAAHDAGIIHRDLKPANVKVRTDGMVKVLDFGLAKALDQGSGITDQGSAGLANSPTITSPAMTLRGMILGTAAYMAPEQAKGKAVDRRADIWAFGCVLYEMLTGQRTFAGEDVSDTLVSILRDDPRWAALPPGTPAHIRLLLRRCLQRDPQKRLPHIGAARLELAEADAGEPTTPASPSSSQWRVAALVGAITGAAIVGAVAFSMRSQPAVDPQVVQFTIEPPADTTFAGGNAVPRMAVSRDGQHIVFQTNDSSGSKLWIRSIGSAEPIEVPGSTTDRGGNSMQQAFWSPDNRFIAFFDEATHELKRLDRTVGVSQLIAQVPGNQYGGDWSSDDAIIFSSLTTGGIQQIAASGGPITRLTKVDSAKSETSHLWPHFFPDGRHFVFLVSYGDDTPSALFIGSLDGNAPKRLVTSLSSGVTTAGDYLIYVRDESTVAQQVDTANGVLVGNPVLIGRAVARTLQGRAALSASNTGVLIYVPDDKLLNVYDTAWVDRTGTPLPNSPSSMSAALRAVGLSPDDKHLAYFKAPADARASYDIWIEDLVRGIESKVAGISGPGLSTVFSPNSEEFVTRQFDNMNYTLSIQALLSTAPPKRIFTSENGELLVPYSWTPDGQQLIVSRMTGGNATGGELWTIPIDAKRKPVLYTAERVRSGADLSPDGRWLAYTSGAAIGRGQVFIQAYPDARGGTFPVSAIGGSHPRWRGDGRELYFLADGQLMAVDVSMSPRMVISQPRPLFAFAGPGDTSELVGAVYPYDVTSDGQRFVILESKRARTRMTLSVITNWMRAFNAE